MRYVTLLVLLAFSAVAESASLYVSEFVGAPPNSVYYQAVKVPALVDQTVAVGGSSVQSAAFSSNTGIVRIVSDTTCHIAFGVNPTATSTTLRIVAGQPEYFVVLPGMKIAVITE